MALAVVDATGRVVFVNDEFSHLVGHTADMLEHGLLPPDAPRPAIAEILL